MNLKNLLVTAFLPASCAVHADIFMLKNGRTDWTDPASYTNNALPTASDRIFTEAGATNELRPLDEKYADSLAMINLVNQIQLGKNATLVIEVAEE